MKRLTNVKLDGNQLSVVVDNIFQAQESLKYLDLSRNRLAKITNYAFNNLSNLTFLDLSYNKLSRLEELSIAPLKNLNILNISGNLQLDLNEIRATLQVLNYSTTKHIPKKNQFEIKHKFSNQQKGNPRVNNTINS